MVHNSHRRMMGNDRFDVIYKHSASRLLLLDIQALKDDFCATSFKISLVAHLFRCYPLFMALVRFQSYPCLISWLLSGPDDKGDG